MRILLKPSKPNSSMLGERPVEMHISNSLKILFYKSDGLSTNLLSLIKFRIPSSD